MVLTHPDLPNILHQEARLLHAIPAQAHRVQDSEPSERDLLSEPDDEFDERMRYEEAEAEYEDHECGGMGL